MYSTHHTSVTVSAIVSSPCCIPYTLRICDRTRVLEQQFIAFLVVDDNVRQEWCDVLCLPTSSCKEQVRKARRRVWWQRGGRKIGYDRDGWLTEGRRKREIITLMTQMRYKRGKNVNITVHTSRSSSSTTSWNVSPTVVRHFCKNSSSAIGSSWIEIEEVAKGKIYR